jgi:glutathione S-transferase
MFRFLFYGARRLVYGASSSLLAVKVDLKTHTLADGSDYYKINPKGAVPALMVDGELLTENTAVLSLVADLNPAANLGGGEHGTMERYHGMEALAWVGSELHKTFGPLFNPTFPEEGKTLAKERLHKHFKMMDSLFAGQKWLTKNADPTVADYYGWLTN